MKIGILEPADFSEKAIALLGEIGSVEVYGNQDTNVFISDKDVLFVRLKNHLDKQFLKAATHLKYICSPTTGLNHIDPGYVEENAIKVISLKGESGFLETIRATPEHSLGLLLALKRNYKSAFLNSSNSEWNRDLYRGYEIYGSKVGIIGLGRVGGILARYLISMGAECRYCDIEEKSADTSCIRMDNIDSLLEVSDTVFLCSSYSESQGILIGKDQIDAMKGKYFINTARAELTDENYLLEMASGGHFKGLAIDVLRNEQSKENLLPEWIKVADKCNVLITPHIGGATYTSMERTEEFIAEKLKKEIEGR